MTLTSDTLRTALEIECGVDTVNVEASTPLFSSGMVDSFSLVSLMLFIEKQAGITIAPMDVTLENFDSIERILAYTARVHAGQKG